MTQASTVSSKTRSALTRGDILVAFETLAYYALAFHHISFHFRFEIRKLAAWALFQPSTQSRLRKISNLSHRSAKRGFSPIIRQKISSTLAAQTSSKHAMVQPA